MKLAEQLDLLAHLGRLYEDTPAAALPLATCLRVLLHNTDKSFALLHQLGELDGTAFMDTALPLNPRNLLKAHAGLVSMQITSGHGGKYVPLLGETPNLGNPPLSFGSWWSSVVLRDAQGRSWTRKKVVMDLANKEGGAHLDPWQPEDVRSLEKDNSMGWRYIENGDESPFMNNPLGPTVRQIAYEVEMSLKTRVLLRRDR